MKQIKCEVEMTPGAVERITDAFVDLYRKIQKGLHTGPEKTEEEKSA
mgnify:FL=1